MNFQVKQNLYLATWLLNQFTFYCNIFINNVATIDINDTQTWQKIWY